MGQVVVSIWALVAILGVGLAVAKAGVVPAGSERVLTKVAFYGAIPALVFRTVAKANAAEIFDAAAASHVLVALATAATFWAVARFAFGMRGAELTVGVLTACYTNAGNIGFGFLIAIVGNATAAAPILLLQLCVITPIAFAILDRQTGRSSRNWALTFLATFTRPLVLAVVAGIVVAEAGWKLPAAIDAPVEMLAGAALPIIMLAMGISFASSRFPMPSRENAALYFSVFVRCFLGPLYTWGFCLLLGVSGAPMLAAVVAGAVPSANNTYVYAAEYGRGEQFARNAVFLSTLVSMGVVLVIPLLLGVG